MKLAYDVILFEKCNLNCIHCFEVHKKTYDFDENNIIRVFESSFIKELGSRPGLRNITVSFCGGELFMDGIPDSWFDRYEYITSQIEQIIISYGCNVEFEFISNGVYAKIDRIIKLIDKPNRYISISYDPYGRFKSRNQERLCIENIKKFNSIHKLWEISVTLTKQSIDLYCSNINILNQFKDYEIGLNFFIPNKLCNESLIPSDDDLYKFFQFCISHNFFNVKILQDLKNNLAYNQSEKFCVCDNRLIVRNNTVTYNCASYVGNCSNFYNKKITEQTVRLYKKHTAETKRGCLVCEHNKICPQLCWTSILYKNNTIGYCPIKKILENDSNYSILSKIR